MKQTAKEAIKTLASVLIILVFLGTLLIISITKVYNPLYQRVTEKGELR